MSIIFPPLGDRERGILLESNRHRTEEMVHTEKGSGNSRENTTEESED